MHIITNDIYHHGVKGQKWGIRNDKRVDLAVSRLSKKDGKRLRKEVQRYKDGVNNLNYFKKEILTPAGKNYSKLNADYIFRQFTFRANRASRERLNDAYNNVTNLLIEHSRQKRAVKIYRSILENRIDAAINTGKLPK